MRYKKIWEELFQSVRAQKLFYQDKRDPKSEAYNDVLNMMWSLSDREKEIDEAKALGKGGY